MKKYVLLVIAALLALSVSAQDLNSLHDQVIRFYGYQRAGLKSGSSGALNGVDAHKGDNYNGKQLDGGWYDAGDYIKFGMPLSYTVYCLLKGYDIFPSAYADKYKQDHGSGADGIPDILNQVKYATDYLMKAVIDENTVILDVGIAQEEHKGLDDPIVNSGGRDASKCKTCSGADIPATYAACLALMSTVYREFDDKYADDCLAKAKVAFKFAKKKIDRGGDNNLFSSPQLKGGSALYDYYTPEGGKMQRQIADKMVAAGVELYRATNDEDPIYKAWARRSISEMYNCMSYSFVGPLASFEVWRQGLGGASSVFENVSFVGKMVQESGPFKGVYKNSGWGTARDVGTAAFVYALGYVTTSTEAKRADYEKMAKEHVAWVSGKSSNNSQSYIVGFGNGPSNIHYRSPNTPKGGLVSGPSDDGSWNDDRTADHCEVAIDYNAGICGAVAFLKALDNPGTDVQVKTAFSATPENTVDLTSKQVTFKAGFSKDVNWTLTITGGSGSKEFTDKGSSVNQMWDGSADKGLFLSGENVAARLTIDDNIVAYDILKVKAVNLFIEQAKKLTPSSSDVPVEDFTDGDSTNQVGGEWLPIGDQTSFAGRTKIYVVPDDDNMLMRVNGNVTSDAMTTFAGVKTTFNATGSAQSIGAAKTVAFDCYANKETNVTVELEQPGIADSAYYCMTVPVTTLENTYRLDVAKFKQPDWKTAETPLDLNAISSIRFTMYDSCGMVQMFLDNVAVENLSTAQVTNVLTPTTAYFRPMVSGATLQYIMPRTLSGTLECTVFSIAGKVMLKRNISANPGTPVSLSLTGLPSGMYTVSHSSGGVPAGETVRFTRVR